MPPYTAGRFRLLLAVGIGAPAVVRPRLGGGAFCTPPPSTEEPPSAEGNLNQLRCNAPSGPLPNCSTSPETDPPHSRRQPRRIRVVLVRRGGLRWPGPGVFLFLKKNVRDVCMSAKRKEGTCPSLPRFATSPRRGRTPPPRRLPLRAQALRYRLFGSSCLSAAQSLALRS